MGFLRTTARGRSEATPARMLVLVGSVIVVVVAILVVLLFLLQEAV